AVVQALGKQAPSRMVWVTLGAVAVASGEEPAVASSPLWGLGRTVMAEQPELGCKLLDIEASAGAARAADIVVRELGIGDGESQVAWRDEKRHVGRLVRAPEAKVPA